MQLTNTMQRKIKKQINSFLIYVDKNFTKEIVSKDEIKYKLPNTLITVVRKKQNTILVYVAIPNTIISMCFYPFSFSYALDIYDNKMYLLYHQLVYSISMYYNKYHVFDELAFKETIEQLQKTITRLNG